MEHQADEKEDVRRQTEKRLELLNENKSVKERKRRTPSSGIKPSRAKGESLYHYFCPFRVSL